MATIITGFKDAYETGSHIPSPSFYNTTPQTQISSLVMTDQAFYILCINSDKIAKMSPSLRTTARHKSQAFL